MIAGGQGSSRWVASVLFGGQGKSSVHEQRGECFSKVRRRFIFENREFFILSILTPKTTILGLETGIFGRIIIAPTFHESPAATTDMTALLSELEALRAGSLASSGVPSAGSGQAHSATYRSGTPRIQHPVVARWHDHLHGLATAIHETFGLEVHGHTFF